VPHIINNAYGVQARALCTSVAAAARRGRVDAIIQSTDKNFMVPVGGSLVASPECRPALAAAVAKLYPGRASGGPLVDLLATLLHWGAGGWVAALAAREALYSRLKEDLGRVAAMLGERLLETPGNPISLAITVDGLARAVTAAEDGGGDGGNEGMAETAVAGGGGGGGGRNVGRDRGTEDTARPAARGDGGSGRKEGPGAAPRVGTTASRPLDVTFFGSMLWARGVSGTRVVVPGKAAEVAGVKFPDYGGHCAGGYPHVYVTAAAALGAGEGDVREFCARFIKAYHEFLRLAARQLRGAGGSGTQETRDDSKDMAVAAQ
jgi:hypothetical protein